MRLSAAILVPGIVLLARANAQNATYNAQKQPSMYTPVSSPAKCSPDGWITVTQINPIYDTQYVTQWKTTTYTQSQPGKTITTCTGSMGGYSTTKTVTTTTTTSLPCTGKPTTVTSYQNCIPVSRNPSDTKKTAWRSEVCIQSIANSYTIESFRLWLSKSKAGTR